VALIPTTLELTTLADLRAGSRCNLETDIIARTVVHVMRNFR
jgi:riboflavin synthase alpha subunit